MSVEVRQRDVLSDIERAWTEYSGAEFRCIMLDNRPTVADALFPLDRYTCTATTDLFADDEASYFDNTAQFFALQKEAVGELANRHAETAAWVEVTNACRVVPPRPK